MRPALLLSAACLLLPALFGAAHLRSEHQLAAAVLRAEPQQASLPRRILWVWERPEDLHFLNPRGTGVAVLEQTLRLGAGVSAIPRRQPLVLPPGIARLAVVRMETTPGFAAHHEDPALLAAALADLERVSRQPGIAALQIDFDARRSEHAFYRRLLTGLRQRMPATLPLQITALVSWCTTGSWIGDLPINAATPMFFRMEPDRRRLLSGSSPAYAVQEPLCSGSAGLSTSEPPPPDIAGKQVFLFSDHGWARDTIALSAAGLSEARVVQP